jgi:galactokinase
MWAAPGRVNIIGEHTDYNNGYALPIALPHTVTCAASVRDDGRVLVTSRQRPNERVELSLAELANASLPGWACFPLGVVYEYLRRGYPITGVTLELDGSVPVGAGLSSSAAVECAVAIALRDLFGLPIREAELIDIASTAENSYVGVPTGTLDQSASVLCTQGHALFVDFLDGGYANVPFDLPAAGLELLVVDTKTPHQLTDGGYATRRAQCEQAAAALGVTSLRDIIKPSTVEALTEPILRQRARHVVTENARVLTVVDMLRAGRDPRDIGPILNAGHASLRDDFEVSTPQLDLAADTAVAAGAYGARMVGGGFGGSIVALTDASRTRTVAQAIEKRFRTANFAAPGIFTAIPSDGASRIL